jgi:aspartate/methionine/tyrosine aminotransferase
VHDLGGGKHVIFNAIQSLVDPGDEAVIPVPFWMTYRDVVEYAGGRPVYVQTLESDGFRVTAALIEAALTARTRLIIINSPSNPTGAVVEKTEFEAILDLAHARGIWVLSDESYARFLYDAPLYSAGSHKAAHENLIISGSVSKTYAMTGWRIGYGLAPEPLIRAMTRLQSHTTTSPTSVAQAAALEALSGPQDSVARMLAEYRGRREYVLSRLTAMPGMSIRPPQGAFYVYPNVNEAMTRMACANASDFASRLLGAGTTCCCARRRFRHLGAHPYFLCRLDGAVGTRHGPPGEVRARCFLMDSAAVRLVPRPVPKVWGVTKLEPWHRDVEEKIGEIWLEHPESVRLPLLVKFLYTSEAFRAEYIRATSTHGSMRIPAGRRRCG